MSAWWELLFGSPNRHPKELEFHPHSLLGPQPVWYFLHPGGTRALLHWRLHRLLHHYQTLPLLPHSGQHARLPAEPPCPHLVPHVLLLRVQRQRARAQWVLLALCQAHLHEEINWVKPCAGVAPSGTEQKLLGIGWESERELVCVFAFCLCERERERVCVRDWEVSEGHVLRFEVMCRHLELPVCLQFLLYLFFLLFLALFWERLSLLVFFCFYYYYYFVFGT